LTPQITGNPEISTTKEVTVYDPHNKTEYATDFGCGKATYVPTEKNWDIYR